MSKGHCSQLEGTLTNHIWKNLSMKKAIMNYKALKNIQKFTLTTDR